MPPFLDGPVDMTSRIKVLTTRGLMMGILSSFYNIMRYFLCKFFTLENTCKCTKIRRTFKNQSVMKKITVIFLFILIICFMASNYHSSEQYAEYVIVHDTSKWVNKTTKVLLIWTKFFGLDNWIDTWENGFGLSPYKCIATNDKSKIKDADAVVFHYHDLWIFNKNYLPEYRDPSQVWIIYNAEAPPHTFFGFDQYLIGDVFNWTMTYRRDSTVLSPYGKFSALSRKEQSEYRSKNYANNRTKMAAAIISNCFDNGRRYRIINELAKYIEIDQFGRCGELACERTNHSICRSSKYRFRIAFENTHCRDYVTEKFYETLDDEVIPVVNWYPNQIPINIPPKSYINLYDFNSVGHLGEYLRYVSQNDAIFNSYFEWKKYYSSDTKKNGAINLCKELHTPHKDQQIKNFHGWTRQDTCKIFSVSSPYAIINNTKTIEGSGKMNDMLL